MSTPRDSQLGRSDFARLVTAADLDPLVVAIRGGRFETLLPGLKLELDFAQKTRWHALTVLRHSAATAELLPADLETRVTGFFHDLGKRASAAPNARGEDSYIGHPERGARMVEKYLLALQFDAPTRARIIRRISLHMALHEAGKSALTDKSLDKVLDRLGSDIGPLSDLAVADTATMSPTISQGKLDEHKGLQKRLLTRAAARSISPWPRKLVNPRPHHAAARAVVEGTAYVVDEEATLRARDAANQALLASLKLVPLARTAHPKVVLIAGLPASGKSRIARMLKARVPHLAHLSSDEVRLALTHGAPTYSGPEAGLTHGTVARLAKILLESGHSVMIDATLVRPRDRKTALEVATGRPTAIIWCEVDEPTATARFARRAAKADALDRSQADAAVRTRMAAITTKPRLEEAGALFTVTPDNLDAAITKLISYLS